MADDLTSSLNAFLMSLKIPFTLTSPLGLTPSILLAILESLPDSRIQIPPPSRTDQIHIVKIFLGVLENDILRTDIGLSGIDPRKLANGEEKECRYIGELLCWLGRRLVEKLEPSRPICRRASSTNLPVHGHGYSIHSFSTSVSKPRDVNSNHCPSGLLEDSLDLTSNSSHCACDLLSPVVPPLATSSDLRKTIRQTGYIGMTDDDVEISSFLTQNLDHSVCSILTLKSCSLIDTCRGTDPQNANTAYLSY
jgi:hypothetical protein